MCCELGKRFLSQHFTIFHDLVEHAHDHLPLIWWIEHVSCIQYAGFDFFGSTYMLHTIDATIWITSMVNKEAWSQCVEVVKQQCAKVVASLLLKLKKHFPAQKLLTITRVIYP